MKESNFLSHCLEDCLKPYSDFLSLQSNLFLQSQKTPFGCFIYISSSKSSCNNFLLTSSFSNSRLCKVTSANNTQIEASLTTSEKISWKSIASFENILFLLVLLCTFKHYHQHPLAFCRPTCNQQLLCTLGVLLGSMFNSYLGNPFPRLFLFLIQQFQYD